ncbi:hypothetical protein ACWDBF_15820 [Streptomyces angustmyceticus]
MVNTDKPARAPRPVPYVMDEDQARLLATLSEDYADALPQLQARTPQASVAALLHAVHAHQAQRLFVSHRYWQKAAGETEVPEDRADDIAAALALLQALECSMLLAARTASARTGNPLLSFKQIAASLGIESEQAAQGRYRHKVGTPNATAFGIDGTP